MTPLDVLEACESGVENIVAFLSSIAAQGLEMLASLMGEKTCVSAALF